MSQSFMLSMPVPQKQLSFGHLGQSISSHQALSLIEQALGSRCTVVLCTLGRTTGHTPCQQCMLGPAFVHKLAGLAIA